jgi:hypothetical protein
LGIERESFLKNSDGTFVSGEKTTKVLELLSDSERFGYEFPACQLEDRVGPLPLKKLRTALSENDKMIATALMQLKLTRSRKEVEKGVPLEAFSDPTGRYQVLIEKLDNKALSAAFSVIGTHIHIGMPNHKIALKVYNKVIKYTDYLCFLGNSSKGERLRLYKKVSPDFHPPKYKDWEDFFKIAQQKSFAKNPRDCWSIIRISVHGTIEFRMFGASPDIEKVLFWAKTCHQICKDAINSP